MAITLLDARLKFCHEYVYLSDYIWPETDIITEIAYNNTLRFCFAIHGEHYSKMIPVFDIKRFANPGVYNLSLSLSGYNQVFYSTVESDLSNLP